MSAISDKYEKDVAAYISAQVASAHATRPKVGSDYSDIKITYNGVTSWMEVKMDHNNRLVSSRVYYKNGRWGTTYPTNVAKEAVKLLNKSDQAKKLIADLKAFLSTRKLKIPLDVNNIMLATTLSGQRERNAVQFEDLEAYFAHSKAGNSESNKYIMIQDGYNVGLSVTNHFTKHKSGGGAHYIQTGDDFLKLGTDDPLGLDPTKRRIPTLKGTDKFKVRFAKADRFYEIVTELKILNMPDSKYSLKPGTKKRNPFLVYKTP